MRNNWIEFYQTEKISELKEWNDAFCVRTDRDHVWLQRLCIWVLRKLDAHATYTQDTITRIRFDSKEFISDLFAQYDYVCDEFTNVRPSRLYIGPDEFNAMTNTPEIKQIMSFNTSYNVGNGQGRCPDVLGLKVTVLPWMKGILVAP